MDGLFFLLMIVLAMGLFAWMVYSVVYAFSQGRAAFQKSRHASGEYALTLRLLGVNLCEPLVNGILITCLLYNFSHYPFSTWRFAFNTLPMAVLLLPLWGLRCKNPLYWNLNLQILGLGLARWAVTLLIFLLMEVTGLVILLLIPFGTLLLFDCCRWGHRQLIGALALPPYPPQAAVALPRVVANNLPARASAAAVPPARPPDQGPPVPCPLCRQPAPLLSQDCPVCGLVFVSRIPATIQALPRYSVLRPLEMGGMSWVYLARDHTSDRLCVLKTLASVDEHSGADWQIDALACLRREAALLSRLDHPGVVRLVDYVEHGQGALLSLAYVAGLTLEQRLDATQGGMQPGTVLGYASAMAEVLCYLHGLPEPVIHGDIKPANLILPPNGSTPVLIDFGSAVQFSQSGTQTTRLERYGT